MIEKPSLAGGLCAVALFAFIVNGVDAQTESPCSHEKSREFNFWIGEWDVYSNGDLAGTNSIRPILDGCVLLESWSGARGSAGSSFNFYNPQSGKWQQFWVWRNGTTLELEGEYGDGKMILEGVSVGREGNEVHNRITWYDNEDGTVRQHWETRNRGETWETAFDGLYRKHQ
jgi:hypothetical protein